MTKLTDTLNTVEELKNQAESLYSTPEGKLLSEFENYKNFRDKLNSLLSTIARYRIQLDSSQEKVVFGPKTLKTIESLVSDYDKLYEIYEEHLYNIFSPVEPLYNEILFNSKKNDSSKYVDEGLSINEETKSQLNQIDEYKKKLENENKVQKVDFDNIQKKEVVLNDLSNKILYIYRNDPCDDLEKILFEVYESHQENFVQILQNISTLITEISRRPDEVNLRILRINNEKLQDDFLKHENSSKLLKFSGFTIATTSDLQTHLTNLGAKFDDEYFFYLHEPDMFTLYDRWKDWLDNLNNVSSTLTSFLSNFKILKRTENDIKTVISKSLT